MEELYVEVTFRDMNIEIFHWNKLSQALENQIFFGNKLFLKIVFLYDYMIRFKKPTVFIIFS